MHNLNEMNSVEVLEVNTFSEEVLGAMIELLKQLTSTELNFAENTYREMLSSENSTLLIARDKSQEGKIIGTLSYASFRVPTGLIFRIEDVVVDQSARGKGVGRKLMGHAIRVAHTMKADKIDLTSSQERFAANQLYKSLGFKIKETNVYRLG